MGAGKAEPQAGQVHDAVVVLLRDGLPARLSDPVGVLLELRGVIARSVNPEDFLSRLDTLNQLLKQLIRRWPREAERSALAALFGVEKGYAGRTLTDRRERAASHLDYGTTHFRKQIEPRLIGDFSVAVWQDNLRYTPRTKYSPPVTEISGDTPALGPTDYNEQEELVSRIWSEVYGLRAEIIAGARIQKNQAEHNQLPETTAKIRWRTARLLTYVSVYVQDYGDSILQGESEWRVEGLIRLAGWRGGISDQEANQLRLILASRGEEDWRAFILRDVT